MKRLILILGLITSFAYAQSKAGFYVVGGQLITVQDDASKTYLKAVENAGVVPSVLQNMASNFLVTTERAIGSYSLMSAQYPYIGGTAATHKFNLNDPRDLDAAFRLTYGGTVTHSALGMQGDGSTGYADTKLNPSTSLTLNSTHLSVYSQTQINGSFIDIGARENSGDTKNLRLDIRNTDLLFSDMYNGYTSRSISSNTDSKGYFLANRNSLTSLINYKKGQVYNSISTTSTGALPNIPIYLMAINNIGVSTGNTSRLYSFFSIGAGFTDTQAIQQSQIVTSYNGFLGRQ